MGKGTAKVVAFAVVGSLVATEAAGIERRNGLGDHPHTETDVPAGARADTTNPYFVSGGQQHEGSRLHLIPTLGPEDQETKSLLLVELRALGHRPISANVVNLNALLSILEDGLGLPSIQVETIKANLLRGERTEIGGHRAALWFHEETLRRIGLDERGPLLGLVSCDHRGEKQAGTTPRPRCPGHQRAGQSLVKNGP